MKRDRDVIREIMLAVEDSVTYMGCNVSDALPVKNPINVAGDRLRSKFGENTEKATPWNMKYHAKLLIDGEILEGSCTRFLDGSYRIEIGQLTNEGHDLLDRIRKDNIWEEVKKKTDIKSVPFRVLKEIAERIILSMSI